MEIPLIILYSTELLPYWAFTYALMRCVLSLRSSYIAIRLARVVFKASVFAATLLFNVVSCVAVACKPAILMELLVGL